MVQNGPSTLGKASVTRAETPKVQVQNVQATASHENHANPLNFNDTNLRSSEDKQNRSSAGPGSMNSTTAATHPDLRSSGIKIPLICGLLTFWYIVALLIRI